MPPDRPSATAPAPPAGALPSLPDGMTPAILLWVSDYVDALLAEGARRERDAFGRGREIGHAEGRAAYEAEERRAWRILLDRYAVTMKYPPHAELEARRYGQGGRPSWVIHRPDDPGHADAMEAAHLPANAGRTPAEHRRRARRRGDPDPFHLPHGPAMTCTACASWGLECPDDKGPPDA